MKLKVLYVIMGVAIVVGVLVYRGYLDGKIIAVKARYVHLNCSEKGYFMQVTSVNDNASAELIDQFISPEILFKQTKLNAYIQSRLEQNQIQFELEGYIKKSSVNHCSYASCFRVKRAKLITDDHYTEF